ncbi:MAG: T9SS type A sorting domain-containing protein [Calditrichaeota bacterium]|nr:T9SS type A sorting domain-containing protein [Calditrichota bacterium]MBT7788969.1 T9SS type A sorting domain-containing protein [Calditrichota bacterium]
MHYKVPVLLFIVLLTNSFFTADAEVIFQPNGAAFQMEEEAEEFIISLINAGDQDVNFELNIRLQDLGEEEDVNMGPFRDRRGEPQDGDEFEYEWRDNLEDDGPEYEWIDIREFEGVRQHVLGDDENTGQLDFGWNFPLYDEEFDHCWACSDGWSSVFRSQYQRNVPDLPNRQQAWNGTLLWSDGDWHGERDGAGPLYFWTNEEDMAIITWNQWNARDGGTLADVQVIYRLDGMMTINYGADFGNGNRFNDGQGTYGAEASFQGLGDGQWGFQFKPPNQLNDYLQEGRVIGVGPRDAWLKWIMIEEREGVIEADGDLDLVVTLDPEGMEEGVNFAIVELELDDPDQPLIQIPVVTSVNSEVFNLYGIVCDAADDSPVNLACVESEPFGIIRACNGNGRWEIEELPIGEYDINFSAEDFLPHTETIDIQDGEEFELNFALLHSECNLDLEEVSDELPVDGSSETIVTVSNDGNGPLTFSTDKRLLGDANAEPWELRVEVPAGVIAEDPRIHGAVFINDRFYTSGANDGEAAIYVLNRDQELINQYAQLGESRYGYKDLASDGEIIFGSGERLVFGFTPDGEEVSSFDCGISPCNNLAWDSDRDILWCSGTTTNIIGFDRDGNQIGEVDRQNLRIYGLAYWPDDPDGYQLYVYHKINEVGNLMVAKYDIENNQVMDIANLQHEIGGVAQGCFITNQYDIYSWVFMGTANSGAEDRVDIWQIDARKDWMDIDPSEGIIEGGEQQEFTVTLDATGLPQAPFEGEIVFTHDGIGGETHLPLTLQVGEGGGPEEMVLELNDGWNMISAYVQPDPDDIVEIMAGLVEARSLIMVKNSTGQFYNAQFGFNNIPGWMVDEGYMIKMDSADELTLAGEAVPWDQAIELDAGWKMVSYYPRQGVDAILALSGIVDVLLMAKDGAGRFYNPAFGFSNMGDMIAGQGYLLKMDEAAELIYTVEEEIAAESSPHPVPNILPNHLNTGENMSLLIFTNISEGEIGVYTNGNLVGSGVIYEGKCGLAVWGDDPTTSVVDGALKGETLKIRHSNGTESNDVISETITGDNKYIADGFQVVRILDVTASPEQFGIVDTYPNPFNSTTRITINLPEALKVDFALYDLSGRVVFDIASGHLKTGMHTFVIDGSFLASGVYIAQLQASGKDYKSKITLLK